MIGLLALLTASAATPPRYVFCGLAASSVDELARDVLNDPALREEAGTGQWRVRSNGRDMIWSIELPEKGGPHAVVCRHLVAAPEGVKLETRIACDGTDADCDKVRDDFVALNRRVISR